MSPLSRRPARRSPPGLIQHLGDLISCLRLSGPQAAISIGDGGTSKDPQTRPLCKEGNRRGKGASSETQSQILFFFFLVFIVPLLSYVRFLVTPWTAARQASLSITNSQSLFKPMSIESVMPSNHLILCRPLLLLPSVFPSIRVFSNKSALRIRWYFWRR